MASNEQDFCLPFFFRGRTAGQITSVKTWTLGSRIFAPEIELASAVLHNLHTGENCEVLIEGILVLVCGPTKPKFHVFLGFHPRSLRRADSNKKEHRWALCSFS